MNAMVQKTEFWGCTVPGAEKRERLEFVLESIRRTGGRFLRIKEGCAPIREPDPEPSADMDEDGNILYNFLEFEHTLLMRNNTAHEALNSYNPSATLMYINEERLLTTVQNCWDHQLDNIEAVIHGQLELGKVLYPHLLPRYGCIDNIQGRMATSGKNVKKAEWTYLLWANFLGPAYVEKYGRDMILNAPGWQKNEFDDGGILHVATENFVEWQQKPSEDVVQYFRKHIPGIKIYRSKIND